MKSRETKSTKNINAPLLLLFLILFRSRFIGAHGREVHREFDYDENSEKGPSKWGELKKEWIACKNGTLQSPIDISSERVWMVSQPEKRNYRASMATLKNRGHDVQIQWLGNAGSIFVNKAEYRLQQVHWHFPSEHSICGQRYDMELHVVHQCVDPNVKDQTAVVGVLYEIGKPDEFLSKLTTNISSIVDKHDAEIKVGMIDPHDIYRPGERYFRYMGSLTTPPCTEGVIWTINEEVKTVSRGQIKLLRDALHGYAVENARPLQPQNSREIFLFGSGQNS